MFFSAVLALALRTLLVLYNRKLVGNYGGGGSNAGSPPPLVEGKLVGRRDDDGVAVEDYGPRFRYVL